MKSDNFTTWRKATYSHANSNCVEVASGRRLVGVRDTSQHGPRPVLQFSVAAWQAFIDEARQGVRAIHHDQLALHRSVLDTGLAVIAG